MIERKRLMYYRDIKSNIGREREREGVDEERELSKQTYQNHSIKRNF